MKMKLTAFAMVACCVASGAAFAELNPAEKNYVDQLLKGGPNMLQQAAESIYNTNNTNPEVLDVLAQVLIEKYPGYSMDRNTVNSAAWMCRALGQSGNGRYRNVIMQVADDKSVHKKLRGHCEKAGKPLPKDASNAYVAGTVNLEALRNPPPPPAAAADKKGSKKTTAKTTAAAPAPAPAPAPAAGGKAVDFSLIAVGMSQQEVNDLLGPPTGQRQHMTGKQFRPFNFGARDLQRMHYLYKGVGRIEFSLKSAYEGVFRVITIVPDPSETGYP
jgi:hypothetical protein